MNNYLVISSNNVEKILFANNSIKGAEKFVKNNFHKFPNSEMVIYECKEIKTFISETNLKEK